MAGVDTVLRLMGGSLAILVIIVVGFFGVKVIDPIFANLTFGDMPSQWGAPEEVVYLFVTLAFIGLIGVVIIWWLVAPVRDDTRQDIRQGGPPL